MQNFRTLGQPLLGEKYVTQKKEEEKNNPKNSDLRAQGQCMQFARTTTNYCKAQPKQSPS